MFDAPIALAGPFRRPRQMLADQEYGGHASLHDDRVAGELGFRAGPIEGPTHFSLFAPLLERLFGSVVFEKGRLSAHYLAMVVEGEETRAFAETPVPGSQGTRLWAEKADGTRILEASFDLGEGESLLAKRLKTLRPPGPLLILEDLKVGMRGAEAERVRMDFDQPMGALYPFSLREKLQAITEPSPWYADASPWGRPVIPFEMISVLAEHSSAKARFPVKGPSVGLFADQQIHLLEGPLFVGEDYLLRREVVALSESRRTESYWVKTQIFDASGGRLIAEMLLNHATLKASFAGYAGRA